MTAGNDQPSSRAPRSLLGSIRDVLFESQAPTALDTPRAAAVPESPPTATEVEAARAVLHAAVDSQLGPGIREFSLQTEALSDVLPDAALRLRAALRVLALKGTTPEHLVVEIEHALGILAAQGQAFAAKLRERREAEVANQRTSREQCAAEIADAERTIARLQTELDAQRQAIAGCQARGEQERHESEASLDELGAREIGFERALHELQDEYLNLKAQLARESL